MWRVPDNWDCNENTLPVNINHTSATPSAPAVHHSIKMQSAPTYWLQRLAMPITSCAYYMTLFIRCCVKVEQCQLLLLRIFNKYDLCLVDSPRQAELLFTAWGTKGFLFNSWSVNQFDYVEPVHSLYYMADMSLVQTVQPWAPAGFLPGVGKFEVMNEWKRFIASEYTA